MLCVSRLAQIIVMPKTTVLVPREVDGMMTVEPFLVFGRKYESIAVNKVLDVCSNHSVYLLLVAVGYYLITFNTPSFDKRNELLVMIVHKNRGETSSYLLFLVAGDHGHLD